MKRYLPAVLVVLIFGTSTTSIAQSGFDQNSVKITNQKSYSKSGVEVPQTSLNRVIFEKIECISDSTREAVKQEIKANKKILLKNNPYLFEGNRSDHPLFIWPIQSSESFDDYGYYTVNFLVDHNSTPNNNLTDYNCGARTYDWGNGNHEGTDLILWPYPWLKMQNEVMEVVAAAPGVILDKRDGNYDLNCSNDGNENWNGIVLEHADGSQSWYWHFKNGAITSKSIGESVVAGEYLGNAGSSGSSNWPHLHFEIYDSEDNLIDPFVGTCNDMNDESWWADQPDYFEPNINTISTHYTIQYDEDCPNAEETYEQENFVSGDSLILRVFYKDLRNLAITDLTMYAPNGDVWYEWSFESPWVDYATVHAYWIFLVNDDWSDGEYSITAGFDGEIYETTFTVGNNTGIKESGSFEFLIYPNPANNELNIKNYTQEYDSDSEIISYNIVGEEVYRSIVTENETRISTVLFPAGVYLLQMQNESKINTQKVIINHWNI